MNKREMKKAMYLCENVARLFMEIDPEFSFKSALCFSEIYMNEGISIADLSRITGIPQTSLTHITGTLSNRKRSRLQFTDGYNLIEKRKTPDNKRSYQLYLTDEGRKFVKKLAVKIEKAHSLHA